MEIALLDEDPGPPPIDGDAAWKLEKAPGFHAGDELMTLLAQLGGGNPVRSAVRKALCHVYVVPEVSRVLLPWLIRVAASRRTRAVGTPLVLLADLVAGDAWAAHAGAPFHPDIAAVRADVVRQVEAAWPHFAAHLPSKDTRDAANAAWLLGVLPGCDADVLPLLLARLDHPPPPARKNAKPKPDIAAPQLLISIATIARRMRAAGKDTAGVDALLRDAYARRSAVELEAAAVALVASDLADKNVRDHLQRISKPPGWPVSSPYDDLPHTPQHFAGLTLGIRAFRHADRSDPAAIAALFRGQSLSYLAGVARAISVACFAARGRKLPARDAPQLFDDERALLAHLVPAVVKNAPVHCTLAPDLLPSETHVLDELWRRIAG